LLKKPERIPVKRGYPVLDADDQVERLVEKGQIRRVHLQKKAIPAAREIGLSKQETRTGDIGPDDESGLPSESSHGSSISTSQVEDDVAGTDMLEHEFGLGPEILPNPWRSDLIAPL